MKLALVALACSLAASPISSLWAQSGVMMATHQNNTAGASAALNKPVTITLDHVSMKQALAEVAKQSGVLIQYQAQVLEGVNKKITLRTNAMALGRVLDTMLAGTLLYPVAVANDVVTIRTEWLYRVQHGVITGKVINAKTKQPIAGAKVAVEGDSSNVVTDNAGLFRVTVDPGERMVVIRAVGFVRQAKAVTVASNGTVSLEIALEPSASVLDEVVVTGTVVATERKAIPTPITVITAEDIEKRGITRVDQLFRGEVPGVLAIERGTLGYADNAPGGVLQSDVKVRGSADLSGGNNPLKTFVDGVEIVDGAYLGTIDPQSIERIEIVTGPQAATIYGSGAMGGVMQIFTKRGQAGTPLDLRISLRYGMLENSLSDGKAPSHQHTINLQGGTAPVVTYAANVSYGYTGQWQPMLFNRSVGASLGVVYTQGPFVANGSVGMTAQENGTFSGRNMFYSGPLWRARYRTGELILLQADIGESQSKSTASSQTLALNLDYRPLPTWQHHLTVGRSQNDLKAVPQAPMFELPSDTLYQYMSSITQRLSFTYNTTIVSGWNDFSQTVILGLNGSNSENVATTAEAATSVSSALINSTVSRGDGSNLGAFGRWQVGWADQVFLTVGMRAERNPTYGRKHRIDVTPNYGMTYVTSIGELTMKILGSYGRATRAPQPEQRMQRISNSATRDPSQVISQFANPDLIPERSRGPQGGLELYYGNRFSLSLNHYRQFVSDLIQILDVDSVPYVVLSNGNTGYVLQRQYLNAASIRQFGWEGSATVGIGPLAFKGTYSWNDSRIESVRIPPVSTGDRPRFIPGRSFTSSPTHFANATITYSHAKTSISLVNNYVGQSLRGGRSNYEYWIYPRYARLLEYVAVRGNRGEPEFATPGYFKSDMAMTHQISQKLSATLNITNLGNNFGSETQYMYWPALGRQTLFGLSWRR